MARFRPRKTIRHVSDLREEHRAALPGWKREELGLSVELRDRWSAVHRHCEDQSSHVRLGRLVYRLTHFDYGVRESALAELELATQLIRAGTNVRLLPESQARTADLECHIGRERFFVEVTAMVGSADRKRLPLRGLPPGEEQSEEEDRGVVLIQRILARIRQKAKQLSDYSDPVVLGLSIPRADLRGERTGSDEIWVDLKALAGSVTVLLTTLRQLSAVLICLWDVDPLPSKAGTRLANVALVERPKKQRGYPRVKLLIGNPAAQSPFSERQKEMLEQIL